MEQSNGENNVELFGMTSYSYHDAVFGKDIDQRISFEKISYGDCGFNNFDFREVFINGEPKGEYYVKIRNAKNKIVVQNAALFLTNKLPNCDVGVIDSENILNLEFQIYIKTKDELMKGAVNSMMEHIDNYITTHMNNR
jgi:hypothetical protein